MYWHIRKINYHSQSHAGRGSEYQHHRYVAAEPPWSEIGEGGLEPLKGAEKFVGSERLLDYEGVKSGDT